MAETTDTDDLRQLAARRAGTARSGARMVPFAGYEMPVQYEGIIAEHLWTRENAGLFDVSHMGQLTVPRRPTSTRRSRRCCPATCSC